MARPAGPRFGAGRQGEIVMMFGYDHMGGEGWVLMVAGMIVF